MTDDDLLSKINEKLDTVNRRLTDAAERNPQGYKR